MYLARILLNRKLMGVRIYERYEHALSDILDNSNDLYSCLPDDKITDFTMPKIFTASCDDLGFKVDFEYRYQNGVTVCIEEIMSEESFRRDRNQ